MKRKNTFEDKNDRKRVKTLAMIGSYYILPVPISSSSPFKRLLYITEHKTSNQGDLNGKVIFVTNLPQCNEDYIHTLFAECGEIIDIRMNNLRDGLVCSAHVTFNDAKSLNKVFSLEPPSSDVMLALENEKDDEDEDDDVVSSGFKKWMKEVKGQQKIPRNELKEKADSFMEIFERMEHEEKEEEKKRVTLEAEDGWTLVTHKGKRNKDDVRKVRHKKKDKKKELNNFYTSQIREAKRDQLALLREKFEKDKERIGKLKLARKFNPFNF